MMTPERWKEIQDSPHPDWWFCSDWIKECAKDLIKEVVRLRRQVAEYEEDMRAQQMGED